MSYNAYGLSDGNAVAKSLGLPQASNPNRTWAQWSKGQGGASEPAPKPTSATVKHDGKEYKVYVGPRGGKYVKKGGHFVSLSSLKK